MMNQDTDQDQPPSSLFNKIKRFFTIKPSSLDDVSVLLEDALSARLIDKEAQFIAERAIRLGDTAVKEIMVPRVEMVILAPDEDTEGMIARIIDSGHSRYPVLGKELFATLSFSGHALLKFSYCKVFFSFSDWKRSFSWKDKRFEMFIFFSFKRATSGEETL